MRRAVLAVLVAACGCGDEPGLGPGEPLQPTGSLFVVAHQGDELIYAAPAVVDARALGTVTTVYVTDGDLEHHLDPPSRISALEKAYSGSTDGWACGTIDLGGHDVEHCHSASDGTSLVFLHYPEGGYLGDTGDSLLHLFDGTIDAAAGYTRDGLLATLNAAILASATSNVHTMEIASTHGMDHSDHELVGAATLLASGCVPTPQGVLWLSAHRGDNVATEAPNVLGTTLDAALAMLGRYGSPISDHARTLVQRSYSVSNGSGYGQLRLVDQCVRLDGGSLTVGDCTGAPEWLLERGRLVSNTPPDPRCLQVLPTGEVTIDATCTESTANAFYPDADGHVWSAVPPPAVGVTAGRHLYCLAAVAGRPRAVVCGEGLAPIWTFDPI